MNASVAALMTKALRSLQAAQALMENGFHDFSVSRAYYAMFYAAEAALLSLGQTYSSHSAVIAAFGKEFAKTGLLSPELHRMLKDAFDQRDVADYDAVAELSRETSEPSLSQAAHFIQAVQAFLAIRP